MLLGMFSKKVTPTAAFWGMLIGMVSSLCMFVLLEFGLITPSAITPSASASPMAANFWRAWWASVIAGGITIGLSFFTTPRPEKELKGLVKGMSEPVKTKEYKYYRKPEFWAGVTLAIFVALNLYLW
jgi:SSS family solute:Na+ symporter